MLGRGLLELCLCKLPLELLLVIHLFTDTYLQLIEKANHSFLWDDSETLLNSILFPGIKYADRRIGVVWACEI